MLIFCLFSLFFTVSDSQNYQKMILIYGEPTVGNGYSTHEISWEQCYSMCYWDASCSFSYYYSSQCSLYQYGNYSIMQLTNSDEKLIALKRNLTADTCPTEPTGTDSYGDNGTVYINRITSDGTFWNITYSSNFQCDIGTKLFRRDNYWVCVGVRLIDYCANYTVAAVNLCASDGWMNMTGPYSNDELKYFLANRGSIKGYTPTLWVDGMNGKFMDVTQNKDTNYPKCGSYSRKDCAYIGHRDCSSVAQGFCYWTYDSTYCWRENDCIFHLYPSNKLTAICHFQEYLMEKSKDVNFPLNASVVVKLIGRWKQLIKTIRN
ncbi:hypothetical protein CAEBREN_09804 [Caenorhabditis brenneri]|uniref:PAN-3 domain-containing protein n=1 Tax=Caenorhabditis brenneri TaxID=135651 RepID=G0NVM3_CAEBE|nr:hypothetical protein CAEBREN_09804 [Caenorhabditis brenneri]